MRFAVSYIDWFEHDLITIIIDADDWRMALLQHPKVQDFDTTDMPKTLGETKVYFFDMDSMVEVTEIPELCPKDNILEDDK